MSSKPSGQPSRPTKHYLIEPLPVGTPAAVYASEAKRIRVAAINVRTSGFAAIADRYEQHALSFELMASRMEREGRADKLASEALHNATSRDSTMNYRAIIQGFVDRAIPIEDIKPRENVFTFNAWRAKGRYVSKGQHGVPICTFVPRRVTDKKTGEVKEIRMPRQTTVFHISQTEPLLA